MNTLKRINRMLAMTLLMCPGIIRVGGNAGGGLPRFSYTGTYTLIDDGSRNWRIKFLTSGTFTSEKEITIDICCVGGGAGSGKYACGGGGYVKNYFGIVCQAGVSYPVVVGAGGAANYNIQAGGMSYFALSGQYFANGGASSAYNIGGNGGSGGSGMNGYGGSDGANGTGSSPGTGQGTTTREFGEADGYIYAGGGGHLGGGVNGGATNGGSGTPNTGGGGGYDCVGAGGSGIVVIRNQRAA